MYDSIALTLREHRRHHPEATEMLDVVASEMADLMEDKNEFLVTCEHPDGNPFTRVTQERAPRRPPEPGDELANILNLHRDENPEVIDELSEKIAKSLAKVSDNIDKATFLMKAGAKHPKREHAHSHKKSGKK